MSVTEKAIHFHRRPFLLYERLRQRNARTGRRGAAGGNSSVARHLEDAVAELRTEAKG
ncbi:MAG: hypothetical protein V7K67_31320 [Nostoc sp.]|uniref:hypothetical protein n=1 Tax=Nostoc sp. TaxID=1180 RepID=UPI002FFBB34D